MKSNEWLTLGSHLILKNGVMHLTVISKSSLML